MPQENVTVIVRDVGSALSVEICNHHITAAHKIPSYKKDRVTSLVVLFFSKIIRDTWIKQFQELKGTITAKGYAPPPPHIQVGKFISMNTYLQIICFSLR